MQLFVYSSEQPIVTLSVVIVAYTSSMKDLGVIFEVELKKSHHV